VATQSSPDIVDSRYEAAAACTVCGTDVAAGEGATIRYQGHSLRFRCRGCLSRSEIDPQRYLARRPEPCCHDERRESPWSEWTCD
jgi:hypothetical protein